MARKYLYIDPAQGFEDNVKKGDTLPASVFYIENGVEYPVSSEEERKKVADEVGAVYAPEARSITDPSQLRAWRPEDLKKLGSAIIDEKKMATALRKNALSGKKIEFTPLEQGRAAFMHKLKLQDKAAFDALSADQRAMYESIRSRKQYDLDKAEFKKIQDNSFLPRNFENFAEDKYGDITGKGKSNPLIAFGRVVNDALAGRPEAEGGDEGALSWLTAAPLKTPMRKLLDIAREGSASDQRTPDDANYARYASITAPKNEEGFWKTVGNTKEALRGMSLTEIKDMIVAGVLDPQELPTNIASMGAGMVAGGAAKTALAAKKSGASLSAMQKLAAIGKGAAVPMALDAGIGGASGAFQSGEFSGTDAAMGAGASLGLGAIGAVTGALGSKMFGGKPAAAAPSGAGLSERWKADQRAAHLAGGGQISDFQEGPIQAGYILETVGKNVDSPAGKRALLAAAQDPEVRTTLLDQLVDDDLTKPQMIYAALSGKAKGEAGSAPAIDPKLAARLETAKQALPMNPENEEAFFTTGTKKQQDDKLVKAARSYRLLRENGAIEPNPRFEGKTEADILAERIKQIQKERDVAAEADVAGKEQEALKQEALDEYDLRMKGMADELRYAQNRDAMRSTLKLAHTKETKYGVRGAVLDALVKIPAAERRILLQDIGDIGDVGDNLRSQLGDSFDDFRELAGNTSIDDARFDAEVKDFAKIIKKGLEDGTAAYSPSVEGAPAGRGPAPTEGGPAPTGGMATVQPQQNTLPAGQTPALLGEPAVKVAPEPVDGAAAAREQTIADLADDYTKLDEAGRVGLLEAELKVRPEIAAELGLSEDVMRKAQSSNPVQSKNAKSTIKEAINKAVMESGPELPPSFR